MISQDLLDEVASRVTRHCQQAKGYEEGPWVNPLIPVDSVSAFVMARFLVEQERGLRRPLRSDDDHLDC